MLQTVIHGGILGTVIEILVIKLDIFKISENIQLTLKGKYGKPGGLTLGCILILCLYKVEGGRQHDKDRKLPDKEHVHHPVFPVYQEKYQE